MIKAHQSLINNKNKIFNQEFLFKWRAQINMRNHLDNQAIDRKKEETESQDKNKGLPI